MIVFIGLGLGDAQDITLKGLKYIQDSKKVYLEAYTSILSCGKDALEQAYGKPLIEADRDFVEQQCDEMLEEAKTDLISFLVVGDPFGATTHTDLVLRAKQKGVEVKIVHNASIMNAVGVCGLQLYNFGETVSIPFWTDTWKPTSFCDKIIQNRQRGQHTLCLLDIKVKEQSEENLIRGRKIYEPPRFMTVAQASEQLLESVKLKQQEGVLESGVLSPTTLCVGLARVGNDTQQIVVTTLEKMMEIDLGSPLHSMVIAGKIHPVEEEYLQYLAGERVKISEFDDII